MAEYCEEYAPLPDLENHCDARVMAEWHEVYAPLPDLEE
jgi:hypothetical protein